MTLEDLHQSRGNASLNRSVINTLFLSRNMFLPEEASHIFMTALRLYSPPFTPLSLFDVLHNPAFGISAFGGKEMRRNDSFISLRARDTNPSWPADRMVDIAHPSRFRCQTVLIRAFGWSVVSRSSSLLLRLRVTAKRKLPSARETHTWHRLIHMSQQIRNCRRSGVRWGPDRPVRAVIILLREEIRLLPQVCLFPRVFCGWVCHIKTFHEADIYTLIKTFVIALDRQFQKGSVEEDDWVQLSMVLKLTHSNWCVFAFFFH